MGASEMTPYPADMTPYPAGCSTTSDLHRRAYPKRGALLGLWFRKQKPGLMEPPLLPSSCRLDWTCVMQSKYVQHFYALKCLHVFIRQEAPQFLGCSFARKWPAPSRQPYMPRGADYQAAIMHTTAPQHAPAATHEQVLTNLSTRYHGCMPRCMAVAYRLMALRRILRMSLRKPAVSLPCPQPLKRCKHD